MYSIKSINKSTIHNEKNIAPSGMINKNTHQKHHGSLETNETFGDLTH